MPKYWHPFFLIRVNPPSYEYGASKMAYSLVFPYCLFGDGQAFQSILQFFLVLV